MKTGQEGARGRVIRARRRELLHHQWVGSLTKMKTNYNMMIICIATLTLISKLVCHDDDDTIGAL